MIAMGVHRMTQPIIVMNTMLISQKNAATSCAARGSSEIAMPNGSANMMIDSSVASANA